MKSKHILLAITYAGLRIDVTTNDAGIDMVPLKPVSDLFGLRWKQQLSRVSTPDNVAHLGTCTLASWGAGDQNRDQIHIRLDRVAAYLMGIDMGQVRAQGNVDGAAFLRIKQNEWADALHEYESIGLAVNPNHKDMIEGRRKLCATLCQLIGVYNKTPKEAHRSALDGEIARVSRDLGTPYQPDLLDAAAKSSE